LAHLNKTASRLCAHAVLAHCAVEI